MKNTMRYFCMMIWRRDSLLDSPAVRSITLSAVTSGKPTYLRLLMVACFWTSSRFETKKTFTFFVAAYFAKSTDPGIAFALRISPQAYHVLMSNGRRYLML